MVLRELFCEAEIQPDGFVQGKNLPLFCHSSPSRIVLVTRSGVQKGLGAHGLGSEPCRRHKFWFCVSSLK